MFTCTHCDGQQLKWAGRCGECGSWGTLVEEGEVVVKKGTKAPATIVSADTPLDPWPVSTGIASWIGFWVVGLCQVGYFIVGRAGLVSTLISQIMATTPVAHTFNHISSGEESPAQFKCGWIDWGFQGRTCR